MDAAGIAAKVAYGYGKAASKLGPQHSVYRATSTGPAIAPANLVGTTPFIASATPDGAFRRPSNWTTPEQFGLFDPTKARPGDYLTGSSGTWFVASTDTLTIPMVVQCNVVISIARGEAIGPGLNPIYGGQTPAVDQTLLTDWPASLLSGGHSEAGRAMLPDDPKRFAGGICKLPPVPGVTFRAGDRITVDGGDTWMVAGAFLQSLGWRLELAGAEA